MNHYPVMLNLKGKAAGVAGGGKVAFRKIGSLVESGAIVKVVSPDINEDVQRLVSEGTVTWLKKEAESLDFKDAFIVIAATNDRALNRRIAEETGKHQLVNIVDDPELGNFHVPAKFSRGKLTIAISTGGASPILAKRIKKDLLETYDESYGDYVEYLFQCRQNIKQLPLSDEEKRTRLEECEKSWEKNR